MTLMAIDGHVIPRYSKLDGMTEYGYKYKALGSEQVNLLTAYDVSKNRPVAMKMFDGSKNDKASVKEMIKDVLIEGCLYLMDRGFYSPELKEMLADKKATYIMPVSSNMTSYQEALKRRRGRMKTFIYKRREGLHVIKSVVEYQVSSDENGTRTIYFRNLHEAEGEKANYLECMEKKVPCYTEAKLEAAEKTFGVIILETTHGGTPEEIYNYYKDRWGIETYYDYLKHQMDFNALGVQDWAKLQGLAFMMLLSTLINGSIQERLKQSTLSGVYMPEVLLTASSIKAMKRNNILGHSSIETTRKYLHKNAEIEREAIGSMSSRLDMNTFDTSPRLNGARRRGKFADVVLPDFSEKEKSPKDKSGEKSR